MTVTIIKPPIELSENLTKGVFLAGPIQGAENWQKEAINYITNFVEETEIFIASPRRDGWGNKTDYYSQVDWESKYLELAAKNGVIMFWLCNESKHFCERSYAQTTRFELSEWAAKHKFLGTKIVIGFDNQFSGTRYIEYRCKRDYPKIELCYSLEATCKATANHLKE